MKYLFLILIACICINSCKKDEIQPAAGLPMPPMKFFMRDSVKFIVTTKNDSFPNSYSINRGNGSGYTALQNVNYFCTGDDSLVIASKKIKNITSIKIIHQKGDIYEGTTKAYRMYTENGWTIKLIPIFPCD